MTSLTRNLPWFIRDTASSIIGVECYTSLVYNLELGDVRCWKYAMSKGMGIGIVVGASVMKLPQLIIVLQSRSAKGLSLTSFILETLAYAINFFYSYRNGFPFSTYGENLFLSIQNTIITFLIILYNPAQLRPTRLSSPSSPFTFFSLTLLTLLLLLLSPQPLLSLLQLLTLPLSLSSKLPQIIQNHRSRSTGNLSAFAVGAQVAGCLARVYTNWAEVGDGLVGVGAGLGAVLNGVVGWQVWWYWGREGVDRREEWVGREGKGGKSVYEPWQTQTRPSLIPMNVRTGSRKLV
ncbi:hypothetical protein FB446DRAFT_636723 [Lentinula raphanica]|nr:hypothetical protein FB446DRAFT_636723 [Lentinula raphanica]